MDAVPAQALDRELVGAQLAGVEEAEQLDLAEVRARSSSRYSAARYSRRCQGLSDFSAPWRREREPVRRRDVGDRPALPATSREVLEDRARARGRARSSAGRRPRRSGSAKSSTRSRSKRRFGPRVAQPGVLVGLGVGVDADDLAARAGEHVGAVALAAGEVDDPQAADPRARSTRRRRGGAGTSSSPRARRAACARRSAPAAARRRAGRSGRRAARPDRCARARAGCLGSLHGRRTVAHRATTAAHARGARRGPPTRTSPPREGEAVMKRARRARRRRRPPGARCPAIVRSTISFSNWANAAPRQRRKPPPNGIHAYVAGRAVEEALGPERVRLGVHVARVFTS